MIRLAEHADLSDVQRVFIELIEDVLQAAPGLRFHLLLGAEDLAGHSESTFAVFLLETNPECDLSISIELTKIDFRLHVNGVSFVRSLGSLAPLHRWIDHRCREVQHLVAGDLRIREETVFALPTITAQESHADGRWRRIAHREHGLMELLTLLLPVSFLVTGVRDSVYADWYATRP